MRAFRPGGHPLHPALVHFPVALWLVAVGADVAGWATRLSDWWSLGWVCLVLGVAAGLLAMTTGLLDLAALPRGHAAGDTAVRHLLVMVSAWFLFVISLAARGSNPAAPPPWWATVVAIAGGAVTVYGGWLGGQLVYRHGAGVQRRS